VQRAVVPAQITNDGLAEHQVRIRMSTAMRARDGHILEPAGCDLTNYRANPVMLWSHDITQPVGTTSELATTATTIDAICNFAPLGISPKADEIRGLVKAGVIRGVSIGFDIIEAEPIDPSRPRAGLHVTRWELYEASFCTVPVDTGAGVTARAEGSADWKCGAARDLAIDDTDAWDGAAAEASIFEHAGGDSFDAAKARKGFLAYNAAAPDKRGSYKLPIAHVADGELKVPKGAIRAAASRLSQTDIPESVKDEAGKVLDHYKEKAGMTDTDRARKRMLVDKPVLKKRGLYECANLAYMLESFGYLHSCSEWEEEMEQDDSQVPAMLGEALKQLGAALVAMTAEEVKEMLAGKGIEEDDIEVLPMDGRAFVRAVAPPRLREFRLSFARARLRAGRVLSKANAAKLEQATDHLQNASDHLDKAKDAHGKVGDAHEQVSDAVAAAASNHEKIGDHLAAAKENPDEAQAHIGRAMAAHRAMGRNMDAITSSQEAMSMAHGDATDGAGASGRCMRAAMRCMRAVTDGATTGAEDGDSEEVQTSEGIDESEGSSNGRAALPLSYRQRQLAALELAAYA
jgi:HK97 family phage prohead protease